MNNNDLTNEFLGTNEDREASGDELNRLSKLVDNLIAAQDAVDSAGEKLKAANKVLTKIEQFEIPSLMEELKFAELTLTDGRKIKIEEGISASISKANKAEAAAWLMDHDLSEILSYDLNVSFSTDKRSEFLKLQEELQGREMYPSSVFNMNTGKVKSALKTMMGEGQEVPEKLFGIFKWKKAKVKLPN